MQNKYKLLILIVFGVVWLAKPSFAETLESCGQLIRSYNALRAHKYEDIRGSFLKFKEDMLKNALDLLSSMKECAESQNQEIRDLMKSNRLPSDAINRLKKILNKERRAYKIVDTDGVNKLTLDNFSISLDITLIPNTTIEDRDIIEKLLLLPGVPVIGHYQNKNTKKKGLTKGEEYNFRKRLALVEAHPKALFQLIPDSLVRALYLHFFPHGGKTVISEMKKTLNLRLAQANLSTNFVITGPLSNPSEAPFDTQNSKQANTYNIAFHPVVLPWLKDMGFVNSVPTIFDNNFGHKNLKNDEGWKKNKFGGFDFKKWRTVKGEDKLQTDYSIAPFHNQLHLPFLAGLFAPDGVEQRGGGALSHEKFDRYAVNVHGSDGILDAMSPNNARFGVAKGRQLVTFWTCIISPDSKNITFTFHLVVEDPWVQKQLTDIVNGSKRLDQLIDGLRLLRIVMLDTTNICTEDTAALSRVSRVLEKMVRESA